MWDAKSTSDDSKEISHKIGNCITFAIVAVVVALFWNKERFSLFSSCNKLFMFSLCVIMVISLKTSFGFLNCSEKVRDYYEVNGMMNENILGKSVCVVVEEAAVEEELPAEEVKFICRAEAICIHGKKSSKVASLPRVQRNIDNHTQNLRDKHVGSSELMVVEVPVDNHTQNLRDKLLGSSELKVVKVPANNHTQNLRDKRLGSSELKVVKVPADNHTQNLRGKHLGSSELKVVKVPADNHTQNLRDKRVGSSELMVVDVPADNHVVNDKSELEAFNKRVDDFIAKFNRQIRLEGQRSSSRYGQILPAGRYIKAV